MRGTKRLKAMLKEPSTWAGIAAVAAVAAGAPPELAQATGNTLVAITQSPEAQAAAITSILAGVLAVLLPEKGAK